MGSTGDLYIADPENSEIEQVTPDGVLSIIAGTGEEDPAIPGPAASSPLDQPTGVAVNATTGDTYIANCVREPGWWETATPAYVAEMWRQTNSWRDPDRDPATPTVFDHAATRIGQEVKDRASLDPTQILSLASIQELEHEHQPTSADPVHQPGETEADKRDLPAPGGSDDPQRREQLRERLVAAGVPETAIKARTLADVGQGREPAEAAHAAVATPAAARRSGGRNASEQLQRRR